MIKTDLQYLLDATEAHFSNSISLDECSTSDLRAVLQIAKSQKNIDLLEQAQIIEESIN